MNESNGNGRSVQSAPIDTWAVLDFWLRRWSWLASWTLAFAISGVIAAHFVWGRTFTSTAELVHYEPSAVDDAFKPRDLAAPSLVVMLQSEGFFEQVGSELHPALTAKELSKRLDITLDRNNDVVTLTGTGSNLDQTVGMVNKFGAMMVAYTQQMQREEATEADSYVTRQLAQVETELTSARAAVPPESAGAVAALSAAPEEAPQPPDDLPAQIQSAHEQLDELLVRYTDVHPLVLEQRAKITVLENLEKDAAARAHARSVKPSMAASPVIAPSFYGRLTPEEVGMGERLRTLETNRSILIARQRAIQPFKDMPPGYFRVTVPAATSRTFEHKHRLELVLFGLLGAFVGLMGSAGQILLAEFMDNRVKTRADVRRVTGLPLLATLGSLTRMSPVGRSEWAFRAWTALQSHLSPTPNHGMVCGITSAHAGDGRSTWVDLLSRAAGSCGFRVLTITARPSPEMQAELESRSPRPPVAHAETEDDGSMAITANVLSSPGEIVERMAAVGGPPMVNIPLPGWVWSLERRKQWLGALEGWRSIENIVIFIELPPASVPESVLLAENIPNLIWLVDSGKTDAAEIQGELETLRYARCNLVGAVLNRERATPVRGRFSRWVGSHALLAGLMAAGLVHCGSTSRAAEDQGTTGAGAAEAFSVSVPAQRAAWQQNLTLGPGDVVSLHMYGAPELTREEVPIGPDGRISYLEASDVLAAGLTIDQLRDRLNNALGQYRRSAQAFVLPVAYRSKKYYVLGKVVQNGAYPLDRPTTIIEAVARARGFETNLSNGVLLETTDFSKSFLGRGGRHMAVDFERLFQHGDLSQNVALEPGDYLYFPEAGASAMYVLGSVRQPGSVSYSSGANVLSAIAARGGFTEGAWKERVLVIRGSLSHPQLFKVDVAGALTGDSSNLALEAGDILYVNDRPWYKVEDLLDRAASAFVEGAVVTWTGIHLGPRGSSVVSP